MISRCDYLTAVPRLVNLVGKSVAEQSTAVAVSAGFDVNMDIVPLYAEMGFTLDVEGGDAVVNISVPAEVVEEVGDVSSLQTCLLYTSPSPRDRG